ncbi:MAG: DNA polymerase ligase N-terminal domain-containing protein [Rhabdochlamydiaceae bacterium]
MPEGSYGAGPVMIWDAGYYIPEVEISKGVRKEIPDLKEGEKVMEEGLKKGEIKFVLHGKKLHGSFALVKTRGWGPKNSWLLIKHNDKFVQSGYDANEYNESAKSKKTLEEIAGDAQ